MPLRRRQFTVLKPPRTLGLSSLDEIDEELEGWLRAAYDLDA